MEIVGSGAPRQGNSGQPQIQINLAEQPDIKCTSCDGIYFEQAMSFKKISGVLTGNAGQDQIAPVQVFRCCDCGMPCEELMPEGM